ncbi:MAG TPA: hypothetical protein VLE49_08905, partial [Anaerolineales bacterium]|nr:hypothetical protein [Anaerolineales bacterium]
DAATLRLYIGYNRKMLKPIHREMLAAAQGDQFSVRALERISAANIYQVRVRGQFGHAEYHFDDNAFEKSYAYIEEQRALTISALTANEVFSAWSAFGRLTHTAQDFYSHSNYVDLWLSRQPEGAHPAPPEIDPVDPDLLHARLLHSGKIYPLDYLTFFHILKPLILPLLPRDAHGWMNLDSPERGPKFQYAFQAAVKRTRLEFEQTMQGLSGEARRLFLDK